MTRMTHHLAMLGVVSGLVLAMPAVAVAQAGEPRRSGIGCVVEEVDDRGGITGVSVEREGAVHGQFRCVGGQWEFAWAPFGPDDAITAGEIQVDPAGAVSVRQFAGPGLGYDLTMGEMAGIVRAITGSKGAVIDRAVVAVDDGKERTAAEIEALLAGKDTTGVRVLGIIDRPDPAMSTKDIVGQAGGAPESTVVYFSILGAIKDAIAWVADKLEEVGEWIDEHCAWEPYHLGASVTCQW